MIEKKPEAALVAQVLSGRVPLTRLGVDAYSKLMVFCLCPTCKRAISGKGIPPAGVKCPWCQRTYEVYDPEEGND